jgi:hypothetical protein
MTVEYVKNTYIIMHFVLSETFQKDKELILNGFYWCVIIFVER